MAVTALHPSYRASLETWQALRDAYAGSGAVKNALDGPPSTRTARSAGTRYLPRPAGMRRQEQYDAYKGRAIFLGATERAVHGLTGSIFRRAPAVVMPSALESLLEDVTLTGVSLTSFAEQVTREVLLMGRGGVLVDFPAPTIFPDGSLGPPPASSRPYWVLWGAEEITNWRTEQRAGDSVLSLVVLKESMRQAGAAFPSPDFFTDTVISQYRVLRLTEEGVYEVSLWRERDTGRARAAGTPVMDLVAQWIPRRSGEPLSFIPFFFVNPFSLEPPVEKSLLEALVEVNFQHYRHSADYEHGLHLTALPTPYITGYSTDNPTLEIGSATAWAIPSAEARVGMLEFQGQGLQSHERAMETDIKNMAALGARLIESAPEVPETATAVLRRTDGSESPVQALVGNVSAGLTRALQAFAWWAGVTEQAFDAALSIRLNTDLLATTIDPRLLRELLATWLSGGMSFETLYENLRKGEITRPGVTPEDEQALIALEQEARGIAMGIAVVPDSTRTPVAMNGATRG